MFSELVGSYSSSWAVVACSCEARHDLDLLADWLEAGRLDRLRCVWLVQAVGMALNGQLEIITDSKNPTV